jgi:iron complex transport system ATP-binding protein
MSLLSVRNLSIERDSKSLVEDASLSIGAGELVILLGPNGAGKSSLLKACLGLNRAQYGSVSFGASQLTDLSPMQRARLVSYLPQTQDLAWPNRVSDLVSLGRFAHGAAMGKLGETDANAVEQALIACDVKHLSERSADTLSGGEIARVHFARAFAAEAPLLIADEPVAALDPRHQFRIMDLIQGFVATGGGALIVLHDVSLAAKYADRLIWMLDGQIVADGSVAETLTAQRMAEIYGVAAEINGAQVQITGTL